MLLNFPRTDVSYGILFGSATAEASPMKSYRRDEAHPVLLCIRIHLSTFASELSVHSPKNNTLSFIIYHHKTITVIS